MPQTRRSAETDHVEVEWQLDADDLGAVEAWLAEKGPGSSLSVSLGAEKEITDVYYDTEGWRLYRAGYALRVRESKPARGGAGRRFEATVKSLASENGDSSVRRREISEPLRVGEVGALLSKKSPGPVGERLRVLVGARELYYLFEVRTRRKTFDLFSSDDENRSGEGSVDGGGSAKIVEDASGGIRLAGTRVGEVALDESEVLPGTDGEQPIRLAHVEVEAEAGKAVSEHLEDLVVAMGADLGLRTACASKYGAGLSAAGLRPDEALDVGPVDVDDTLSVGEVAFRVLRRQFAAMRAHEPGARLGERAEELHDMRAAVRRILSAVKLFGDALPGEARRLEGDLEHFAGLLDDIRNLEVHIEQIETRAAQGDREHLSVIVDALAKERCAARTRLLEALDSERYESFESSFADLLRRGPEGRGTEGRAFEKGPPFAGEPVLVAAPGILSRPYREWRKATERVGKASSSANPEDYRDLRKKGEHLRCALESFASVYSEKATGKLIEGLEEEEVQDVLGRHRDLIVAAEKLEELATEGRSERQKLPPRVAFVMGFLAGRNLREAEELRSSLPDSKAYRKLEKGEAWKRFEKTVEEKRRSAVEAGRRGKAAGPTEKG